MLARVLRAGEGGPPSPEAFLADLRAELQAQAQATHQRAQLSLAAAVTLHAVRAYWSQLAPASLPLYEPPRGCEAIPERTAVAAQRIGDAIAKLPVAEAGYQLGLLYTGLLPAKWRSSYGVHYTPPSLADRLLDQAEAAGLNWLHAKVLDPAAGAGAFLVPAAQRLLRALDDCEPALVVQNLSARIRGYELDPFAAWLGHVLIEVAALPAMIAAGRRLSALVAVRDSLTGDIPGAAFDLVIANPPFGRVSLPDAQRQRYLRSLYGHANLYGLFMDLATQLAQPGGLISFLTPSSFLAGEYFKSLRALLWRQAPPLSLDFVTVRKGVFEGVLQETVLATYRKEGRRQRVSVSFIHPQPGSPAAPAPAGGFTLPRIPTAPWVVPRHSNEAEFAAGLRRMPKRLADWGYRVSTGPLVWNRHKPQLRDALGKRTVPLIWAECVTGDGRFVFRSQKRNHKPYFRIRDADEWLLVCRPCVLLQRTTAKEQARRLIAAELPAAFLQKHGGRVTIENHLNMLIPTGPRPAVSPAILAAFLNTEAADRAFRCLSGSVAVSAYELENLPLPAAADLSALLGRRRDAFAVERACHQLYLADVEP